jgi:hypothetical protein
MKVVRFLLKPRGFTNEGHKFLDYFGRGVVSPIALMLLAAGGYTVYGEMVDRGYVPMNHYGSNITPYTLDEDKPNASQPTPTFENSKKEARKVCKGKVVAPSPEWVADFVVIVNINYETKLMPFREAWNRNESKTSDDNVWTVAICRKHAVPRSDFL